MSFYVYILECSDNSFYVGHTDNLDQRFNQHRAGKVSGYTSSRLPIRLVWTQTFATRDEAFVAERKIKGWSREKKEALIKGDWQEISDLCSRAKRE